ncbi:MAG: GNAT family N-acetyltransferase, partial [Bacteroidota bacterium]
EVKEHARRKGFGSLMVQELKKEIYLRRRVPAARCNIRNHASKATLQKAGFAVCGTWLKGNVPLPALGKKIIKKDERK